MLSCIFAVYQEKENLRGLEVGVRMLHSDSIREADVSDEEKSGGVFQSYILFLSTCLCIPDIC